MDALESCGHGRDNASIEVKEANDIEDVRSRVNLIGGEVGLCEHKDFVSSGVGDENRAGGGRKATGFRPRENRVVDLDVSPRSPRELERNAQYRVCRFRITHDV